MSTIRYVILASALQAVFLLLAHYSLRNEVVESIALLLCAGAVYMVGVYWIHHEPQHGGRTLSRIIISAAVVFRLSLWPVLAPTTDDLYRYRWEGKLQAESGDPYQTRPDDPHWAHIRDSAYDRVALKEFKGGYGPAWELIEWGTYVVSSAFSATPLTQLFWFKAPAALADLGIIAAVVALLRRYGMPDRLVLIYAWSPLPIWEFWANGHNDSLPVLAVVVALVFARSGRWVGASSMLGLGIALKFWPALLIPAFARFCRDRRALLLLPVPLIVSALPYIGGVTENLQFMSGFAGGWRNNDSLFGILLWLAGGDPYLAKYLAIASVAVLSVAIAVRAKELARASLWTIAGCLLLVANAHPWYLTWFAPLLTLFPIAGLLLWSATVPLAYSVWIQWSALGIWNGSPPERWLVYGPVLVLLGWVVYRKTD